MTNMELWSVHQKFKELINYVGNSDAWSRDISIEDNVRYNFMRAVALVINASGGVNENDTDEFNFFFDTDEDSDNFREFVNDTAAVIDYAEWVNDFPDAFQACCKLDNALDNLEHQFSQLYIDHLNTVLRYFAEISGSTNNVQVQLIELCINQLNKYKGAKVRQKNKQNNTLMASQASTESIKDTQSNINDYTLEDIIEEMNSLIGLEEVKAEISSLVNFIKIREMRKSKGMALPPMSFHLVFTGNPGTGKTTVARIIAKLYNKLGILSGNHLIEVDRSGLVAGYVGQTALKVKEVVERSKNGVLFIDEAYTLTSGGDNDYGREAIEILLKEMEDNRNSMVVIVAGYTSLMPKFLDSNPGLKSRFNRHISFSDYRKDDLISIFEKMASDSGYELAENCQHKIDQVISQILEDKTENFANAREVRNVFEYCISRQADRLALKSHISDTELNLISAEDFPNIAAQYN